VAAGKRGEFLAAGLTAMALAENPTLSNFTGDVADSGEGRWTIEAAMAESVSCEVNFVGALLAGTDRGSSIRSRKNY